MAKYTWFLEPKPLRHLSVAAQLFLVAALYLYQTTLSYWELKETGTVFGYPPFVSILFAPITEEILFRGVILGYFLSHTSKAKSVALSSMLFGLWHFKNILFLPPESILMQMLYAGLIVGPILGWMTLRTKSVWPSIILHYLHNIGAQLIRLY